MAVAPIPGASAAAVQGRAFSKKALVIDDYYARPTSAELSGYIPTLRQFITDNPALGLKEWFDATFGLNGDHKRGNYFDSMLDNAASIRRFWAMRDSSPVGLRLSQEIFSALVSELTPAHRVLHDIETKLAADGWEVRPEPALPTVNSIDPDTSLIAIDYILDVGDPAEGLEKSLEFLRHVIDQCKSLPSDACPFVLLMSELADAQRHAETVRTKAQLHGGYFRFAKKDELSPTQIERIVSAFVRQQPELENYRKLHAELGKAFGSATDSLRTLIETLELQDLATLHAGQLVQEGEPLSDYLAWLYGQYLSAQMMQFSPLANRVANLPGTSHSVLLGHLSASDNIPKLFSAVSLTKSASAEKYKVDKGKRRIRFGDLFVVHEQPQGAPAAENHPPAPGAAADPTSPKRYLLVVSQNCDLLHDNITNGQVLCLDGDGHELKNTETDLLRATIRQMDQQGRILHNEGAQYFEVEWRWQDLRTINLEKLAAETGYRYLGRLHELYALQAQHNVLDRLGRIGVPIQPSHSIYFKKLSVKVIEGKNEIPGLSFATTGDMIVAVLRNEKAGKSKHRLLFSDDVRDWLIKTLATLSGAADTPAQLKTNIDKFHQDLEKRSEYSLIVTVKKETAEFQQEEMVGGTPTPKMLNGAIAIELRGVFDPPARTNARIELVFEKI